MPIDVRGGADRTVTKPCLDIFQTAAACKKQSRTTVPKIMESDVSDIDIRKKFWKAGV